MKTLMEKPERLLELGVTKKDIALLAIGGIALISFNGQALQLNPLGDLLAAGPVRPGVDRSRTVRRADRAGGSHRAGDGI